MRKSDIPHKIYRYVIIFSLLALVGCSKENDNLTDTQSIEIAQTEEASTEEIPQITVIPL